MTHVEAVHNPTGRREAAAGDEEQTGNLLDRLAVLAQAVGTAADLTAVFRALLDFAIATIPCNGLFVSLYSPERAERTCVYAWTEGYEIDVSTLPPLGMTDSPHSRAVSTGQIIVSDDLDVALAGQPRVDLGLDVDPRLPRSSITVPMAVLGRVIGGFEVQSVERAAYREKHVIAMRMAANLAAIAAENVRLIERERELRAGAEASERRYRGLVQGLDAVVWAAEAGTLRFTFVSQQAESIFGYPVQRWLADPNFWATVVHAEDRERVLALYNRTAADGMDHNLEYRAVTADGRVIWIHDVVNVIRDERDRPRELRGLMVEVTERRRAARRLAVQYRLSQVLAQAAALDTAAPLMLQEIGEGLGMDLGTLWWVDRRANVLRCTAVWRSPGTVAPGFEEASRAAEFPPGKGLPGRVWAEGEPVWIAELLVDTNFARLKAAADAGQRAAFAFPVRSGDEFLGVVEFFRGAIRRPDEDLLTVVAALGNQIGQFVERKRAEDALRTSEGRKAAILATALDGIITIDAEGRILEFNPAAEAIFGYRRDEVLNQQMADLIIPASLRERHAAGMRRYLATGHTSVLGLRFETVAKRKGGGEFPVELAITRIPVDGPPVFTGFIRDITQRRQAEERLRETNATLQALIQASPLAIVVLDPDGSVQLWNPAAERIFGWSEEEVLEHPHPVVVENQKDEFRAMLDTVVAGEAFTGREAQRHRRDGAIVDVSIAAAPLYDSQGGVRAVMAVFADVTERRRAEARLSLLAEASTLLAGSLDAETTLKSVARVSVPQLADWCIAYLLDDDGAVRRVAMEYVDPASEILARTIWEEHTLDPRARVGVPQVLRSGLPEFHADASAALLAADVQQPDQLEALLEPLGITSWMCVPLLARGRTLGAISFVSTASGRHYDLDDLALAEELARGAALAVDNARLYQEAQDAVRTRDVFLSVASHELKTPLTALQGYTELLMRRANREGGSNSRDERALKAIHDQAVRLHKLIELLLDLSRIQTGQLEIERGPVDLCSVARRLVEAIEPTLDEHTIQFSCAGEPLVVVGDELRLEQVFQNLLQNAIKYSPDGGPITVGLERRGDQVCLAVADQGIGIPREALSQLFTRFYRAKNVGYRRISGMGLGLYVVKEIVTVLGGEIDVTSQEGQGSTFTVCLPLLASEVSSA